MVFFFTRFSESRLWHVQDLCHFGLDIKWTPYTSEPAAGCDQDVKTSQKPRMKHVRRHPANVYSPDSRQAAPQLDVLVQTFIEKLSRKAFRSSFTAQLLEEQGTFEKLWKERSQTVTFVTSITLPSCPLQHITYSRQVSSVARHDVQFRLKIVETSSMQDVF